MPSPTLIYGPTATTSSSATGTFPTIPAGSNRKVLVGLCVYLSGGNPTAPTACTSNGQSGTFSFGHAPASTPSRDSITFFEFYESQISAISGKTFTFTGHSGNVEGRIVAVLQDTAQGLPYHKVITSASSGTLTGSLNRDNNSFTAMFSICANVNATLTLSEPSYVGRFAMNITSTSYGYAADTFRTANATSTTSGMTGMAAVNFKGVGAKIVDINGGSPVEVGSTVTVNTTGFTGTPTASFNVSGISATVTGSANVWSLDFDERVDGAAFPALPAASNLTLTNGSESAALAMPSYIKKAAEVEIVYSMAVTSDPNYTSGVLTDDGFTVEGGELIYTPYGDFVAFPDGSWTATSDGVVEAWFRPITGTGAGNVYYYEFTVDGGGTVITSRSNNHYIGFGLGIGF